MREFTYIPEKRVTYSWIFLKKLNPSKWDIYRIYVALLCGSSYRPIQVFGQFISTFDAVSDLIMFLLVCEVTIYNSGTLQWSLRSCSSSESSHVGSNLGAEKYSNTPLIHKPWQTGHDGQTRMQTARQCCQHTCGTKIAASKPWALCPSSSTAALSLNLLRNHQPHKEQ